MRKLIILLLILGVFGYFYPTKDSNAENTEIKTREEEIKIVAQEIQPNYTISEYTISNGDVFASALEELGFTYSETMKILDSASSTYDFTKVAIGKTFRLFQSENGESVKLEYEKDSEEIVVVELTNDTYQTHITPITYTTETYTGSGVIASSLWNAGLKSDMPEELIIKFADMFAWTIDFSIQVQPGDSFTVLYEKRFRDGEYAGIGKVLAGEFVNSGKSYKGYLFEDKAGTAAYYSETGEALQKQFLKAPLEFKRITSGYTYARFDPINSRLGPHRAIDYAAAIGTPIMAVGNGTITYAGWNGGYGKFISIHHNDTYTTRYAHMTGFGPGIKKGVSVVQGQVIGYVGSTGHSTGPHLHYEIMKNGTLVNPLELDLPPGDPVPEEKRNDFYAAKENYDAALNR